MDYRTCIQNSIDYIEEHLQESMTVDDLAKIAGFSSYHYYRVFNAYVGIPIMEYVRRRRLSYAAAELVHGSVSSILLWTMVLIPIVALQELFARRMVVPPKNIVSMYQGRCLKR